MIKAKTSDMLNTTAKASHFCAGLGGNVERMKCCSSATTAVLFSFTMPPERSSNAGDGDYALQPSPDTAVVLSCRAGMMSAYYARNYTGRNHFLEFLSLIHRRIVVRRTGLVHGSGFAQRFADSREQFPSVEWLSEYLDFSRIDGRLVQQLGMACDEDDWQVRPRRVHCSQ